MKEKRSVLFVCTGNICRSPTAAGVLMQMVRAAGLEHSISVRSAGTHDYHAGEPPDERAQRHARGRGYDLSALRARRIEKRDFAEHDLIVALDRGHLALLERMCPPEHRAKLRLLVPGRDVPDPYYGGSQDFELVLDLVELACRDLLAELKSLTS
jgi:protein-tyrosine phosphatase